MKSCTYFVEGECERKLLDSLKSGRSLIHPGKVRVFNVIQNKLKPSHLISIKEGYVVFVFDSDTPSVTCLKENIALVKRICPIGSVKLLFLVQVENFEEEIVRATDVRRIVELIGSRSEKDFKPDFIALKDCRATLEKHGFDIRKMWNQAIPEPFNFVEQGLKLLVIKL